MKVKSDIFFVLLVLIEVLLYSYTTVFLCIIDWLGMDSEVAIYLIGGFGTLGLLFVISYLSASLTEPGKVQVHWKVGQYF